MVAQPARATVPAPDMIAYSFDEAARVTGLSRMSIYRAWKAEKLRTYKPGGRRLILRTDLEAFIRGETG